MEEINNIVGCGTTAVETFVNHRAVFVELGEVIAIEVGVTAACWIRQPYVSEFAAAHLVYLAAILFNPGEISESAFIADRRNRHFAGVGTIRIRANPDDYR